MPEVVTVAPAPTPSAPAEPQGVSPDAGDELLIPRDEGTPAPAAEPATAPKGEEAKPPEAAEKPKAEPKVPPGYRTEEEFRRLQSELDRREAARQREIQELRRRADAQSLEGQVATFRQEIIKRLTDNNVDSAQLTPYIEQAVAGFRENFANAQKNQELTAQIAARDQEVATLRAHTLNGWMQNWVSDLTNRFKLDDTEVGILQGYFNPEVIRDQESFIEAGNRIGELAQRLGDARKAQAAAKKAALDRVPAGQTAESPASNGAMTDSQYIKASNAGRIPFDAAKLKAALTRLGYDE